MALSDDEVRHVAKLASLKLSDEEIALRRNELETILEYVDKLSAVQTRGVVPTSHVHGVVNFFREDIIKDSFTVEEVERNAPSFKNGSFRVPRIIS